MCRERGMSFPWRYLISYIYMNIKLWKCRNIIDILSISPFLLHILPIERLKYEWRTGNVRWYRVEFWSIKNRKHTNICCNINYEIWADSYPYHTNDESQHEELFVSFWIGHCRSNEKVDGQTKPINCSFRMKILTWIYGCWVIRFVRFILLNTCVVHSQLWLTQLDFLKVFLLLWLWLACFIVKRFSTNEERRNFCHITIALTIKFSTNNMCETFRFLWHFVVFWHCFFWGDFSWSWNEWMK